MTRRSNVTLLVARLVVNDPQELLSTSFDFDDLRESYGSTSVRFLRDHSDPQVVLALLEFTSLGRAFNYARMAAHADGLARAGVGDFRAEYYEELDRSLASAS